MTVKPSLELLRSLTDEHVLRELMAARRLTRAELAARTGLSKPTIGESVRRLTEAGVVVDTGERTPGGRGRGRVGSFYGLADDLGVALVAGIAPDGVTAECIDPYGDVVACARRPVSRPAHSAEIVAALREVAACCVGRRVRLAVVSAADPVDRTTGRLLNLPDAPFLLGELDPAEVLAEYVQGQVVVDNDVNWAARAQAGADFAYLYLGEGLGCAVVSDGEVRRGHTGIAGEISHLVTTGPDGRATRLIEVFGLLGVRQPDSTAIDVDLLLAAVKQPETRRAVGRAIGGVLAALVALTDPEVVVVGGPWGPAVLDTIAAAGAELPQPVAVRAAPVTTDPSLAGARADALDRLRSAIIPRLADSGAAGRS